MVVQQVEQQAEPNHVKIVSLIGLHTVLSAVIQHGMSLLLTVQHLRVHTVGIALDVAVLVTVRLSVVTVTVLAMKHMKHAQRIVMLLVSVMQDLQLTVLTRANAGLTVGLVTDTVMVLQNSMVQTYVATITMVEIALMKNALLEEMSLKLNLSSIQLI
jgi:hypothetical protein